MDVRGERGRAVEDMAGVAAGGVDPVDRGAIGCRKGEVEVGRRLALDQEQVERGIVAEALGRAVDLLGIAERRQGVGIEDQCSAARAVRISIWSIMTVSLAAGDSGPAAR